MGDTQSAQKQEEEDVKAAAGEQEGTESGGGVTERDDADDNQPLNSSGNFSDTNGKAERNAAACNGHFEDEITATDDDFPKIVESNKEEDAQSEKGEIGQEYSPDETDSNENAEAEISEMEEKQNDINETFRKLFSNIKFKLSVKRGSTDNAGVTAHLTEQDPKTTEDIPDMENESGNEDGKLTLDHNAAPETHDTDSTTCPTLTDDTADVLLESGGENSPGTKEDIEADSADGVTVFSSREEDEQKEPSGDRWHSTASPIHDKEEEATASPFISFFTTGIFSGLQKKKKELVVNKQEKEMEEITERAPQDLEQEHEITVGVEACPNDLVANEPKEKVTCAPSPQLTDASPSPSTYTAPVADISSSQEDKVQASPLKRLLSGSSLKRLSRKPRSRRSSDGRLSSSGEHNSDHYLSSTESADSRNNDNLTQPSSDALKEDTSAWESFKKRMTPKKHRRKSSLDNEETHLIDPKDKGPQSKTLGNSTEDIADLLLSSAENQKEESGAHVSTKASDEGSAWSSFKKLMTPKKLVKKPASGNDEEKLLVDESEIKPSKDVATSDHSTEEEGEKRKELSISWEAVLCGSGKKRSSKKSGSEKTTQIDADTTKEDSGGAKSALDRSDEFNKPLTQSPNQAESFPECDEGLTWKSFKKLVTPKRRAKHEDEAKDYKEPDSISTQEETFSFRKLLSGKKISPCVEKQELSPEAEGKPTSGDDEECETPAVVPLSEFDTIETEVPLQTQANVERLNKSEAGNEIQEVLCEETPAQILPRNSEIEIENVAKSEPLPMEISIHPSSNEESDENTDTSKHQQLSDIPEEGVITETMATPASVADEATKDDTTAEDLIEITSEAVTAPEPDDVSVTDETDMISAVSQLPESSKTSGNTTPVPAEHQEKDTEMLLQQAAETIVTSPSAVQMCSEKTSPEGIVHSVWKQILKTFRNEKSKDAKTTVKMDPNEEAKDADGAAKIMMDTNQDISKEIISGVPTDEFDLAEIADDVCQLQENDIESPINVSEENQNTEKYLDETNSKTTSTEPSPQVEVVIADYPEVAHQTEVQPSKMESERVQSAFTMREETQDNLIKPKPEDTAGADTSILSNIHEEARMETEEPTAQLDEKTELAPEINSREQTEAMKPKQGAENITEVKATLDMQAEEPNTEEANRQLSKPEIPTGEEVSKENVPSTECKPLTEPQTEMSIDNEEKEPSTGYEDLDNVQKERPYNENIPLLSVLDKEISEDASPFQTDENKKIILSEDDMKPAADFIPKPDKVVEDTKSVTEASKKHQVVSEDFADTTLDSKAVCRHLIETKATSEVISATETNEMEVHTEANIKAEDTGHDQETRVLEAGKDSVLEIVAGASHVIETKDIHEIISTAETCKNAMEALAKVNVVPEVTSEIGQTKEPEVSEDVEASTFDSDVWTVKEETHDEPVRTMMSQDILKDMPAFKKEEEKNETTALHKSDDDQVFGPEADSGREIPEEDTAFNFEVARFKLLEKDLTPIAVSDGDEKTPFTKDNIDPMETSEKQKVSETLPEISSHPEQIEEAEVSEVIQTRVIVGANDDLLGEFKRQNAGEKNPAEEAVPASVIDDEARELQHLKKDVISDTISIELAVEDKTINLTEGNGEQVNIIKNKEVLIFDSDPNNLQTGKMEDSSEVIQATQSADETVASTGGNVDPVRASNMVNATILDLDQHIQTTKNKELSDGRQAGKPADETVFLTDGNRGQVNSTKTENVQALEVCEPQLALISDSDLNVQMVKNEEIPEGIQEKIANEVIALTDGSVVKFKDVQELGECEAVSVLTSDLGQSNLPNVNNEDVCKAMQANRLADETISQVSATKTKDESTSDLDSKIIQIVKNKESSDGVQAAELADKTIYLTDDTGGVLSATQTGEVQEPEKCEAVQTVKNESVSDGVKAAETVAPMDGNSKILTATKIEFSEGIQATEPADKTASLSDANGEQGSATTSGDVQEEMKSEFVSAIRLDSDVNSLRMIKNDDFSRGIQLAESADETITPTVGTDQPESAFKPEEHEAAGETVSLTDGKDEQVGSTKRKDAQEQNETKEISDFVLDSDLNNLPMVRNKEGIQAAEPANETTYQNDGNGKPVIAPNMEELQTPKECEAPHESVSLTDGQDEQVGSTKSKNVQDKNTNKEISVFNLDTDQNNLQMVKNKDFTESIEALEPPNETISQTDDNGKPVIAPNMEELQTPKECEAPHESVSLTDGQEEQVGSTNTEDIQEKNKEISVFVLDTDQNNLQMVKNKDFRESIQAPEPANETISEIDDNSKPVIATDIEEHQEPKEFESPHESVSLTDGQDEQVGSTKTEDVQEQNESKKFSAIILDSDPNNIQMFKNQDLREDIQAAEPAHETVTLTEGNGGPVIATNIKDVQKPKECEVAGESVSLTDGQEEQVGSTNTEDFQKKNKNKEISVFVLDSDQNNLQMVKNKDFRESIEALELPNETISQTDDNGKPVIATNMEELQAPKEFEAPHESVSLTDGQEEQVGSTNTEDVQEKNKDKEISVFVLDMDQNNIQLVKNKDFRESIEALEPANETISEIDDNSKPVIAIDIEEHQEPEECEAPHESVSLTDGQEEQVGSTKSKNVQDKNTNKEISVFNLDTDQNNIQMVKNKDFRESIQAPEPANETISEIDDNSKPVIATDIEDHQEPEECEAPHESVSLTDGQDEQVGSTKTEDVQEQNESKKFSAIILDSDPNNIQMFKNQDLREDIQAAEPAHETVTLTEGNGGPVIATNIKDVQKPKECEVAGESVSLTDGQDEQVGSTNTEDVQKKNKNKEISVFVLDSDQNNLQMVKNKDFRESIEALEPPNETISQTDDNGKPVIATNMEELQAPKEFEAPHESVSLTDGQEEQVGSTNTEDIQEKNKDKEISVFVLDMDQNNIQLVKNKVFRESIEALEPANETISEIDDNSKPVIAIDIEEHQEPEECEAPHESVSLTDGQEEQVGSTKSKNVQDKNTNKEISVFNLDTDQNNIQMVKNKDFRESIQAPEPANETISEIDDNSKPVIATDIEEHQEPEECEAPHESVSLTDGQDEQVGSTKTEDVQEQNESKKFSAIILDSDPNNIQMFKNQDLREDIQAAEPAHETVTLTEGNGGPVIATNIKDVQKPKECEVAGESVSLTDGQDEQVGFTNTEDVQEKNKDKEISVFVLDTDQNNIQLVKNKDFRESIEALEPATETIPQTDDNGKPVIATNIEEHQAPKEFESPHESVSLTDGQEEQVGSTKTEDVQEQNESKEILVLVLHSDPNKVHIAKSQNLFEGTQVTQSADEIIALTDGNADPVRTSNTEDVSMLESDPNSLQTIKNKEFPDSSQAGEPADETIPSTDGNGDSGIATNNKDVQEPKDSGAAGVTVCNNEQAVSTNTEDVQEQNGSNKVSDLILDSKPNDLQMAERDNSFEGIQTTEAVDETVSLNDGNGEPVISTKTKDVQEQKEEEAVLALILDSGADKLQMIKNEAFREDTQASDQADQASALNEGNGEPVSSTTTEDIQEQEECMHLTTLILDSESNSLQLVKNDIFSGGIEETEPAPERVIPTNSEGKFTNDSEYKIVQEPGAFEDGPGISQDCIQTVETVEDETESSTGNQLSIGPAEEPKKFKAVLATISDSEPSPLLISREGTEEDLSVNESEERPQIETMNMTTEMFQFVQEVSTAENAENKDQPKDEILPCPKSNNDQLEPSKTEHVKDILEAPGAIISDLEAECSEFKEKDMILKDVTGAKITFCDSAQFTEGRVQIPGQLKINIVQDQDIFKAVPVTVIDLEPGSPQSVTMDQGSEDLPAEETLKSDLKEKTLFFTEDDVETVKSPTVKDIEVVDVVEKATLKSQAITKCISLSKHELEIEPELQDNAEPVEETTTEHIKEEHLEQEVYDLAVGLEVESYASPKKREEPANLPGVIEESSEIESFQEFGEAAEKPNSESNTQSLKTKETSQNNLEGQRSRAEIVQEETPKEILIVLPSDERENLTEVEPNSTPTDAQLAATSNHETGQKKEAFEMNQAQITKICSPDEGEVESAHMKQTLHTNYMPCFTDEFHISHVPENTTSSEEILEKCKEEMNSDKEKENRPQVVGIKTAAVEPAETPQYNANDVIPDTLIEKLSEIQLPPLAGITGETAFQEMIETVTASAPEPITQTAEEVREMVTMHVQTVQFDDVQETEVQVKNVDTESARAVFEPTLEVVFKETNDNRQETIGEVETLLATSEMKDEVIHGENDATVEVVVVLTKDPPDVDYFETPRKLDTVTDVGDQVEDGDKEVEAVVEDNTEIFTEMITEKTDSKYKHEEVESAQTKQTLHTNHMTSFTDKCNISHVPENIASSEDISEKCKDRGRGSTELSNDKILSEIEMNSDKEKENRPQVVGIKTAETPQYNTYDVIPDTLIEKLSEIQLPPLAGITGETAFQEMIETVTASAPEPITQTAEEVREMVTMHVQTVQFDDVQETEVQVKNVDTESARAVLEPTLEVVFKETDDNRQETIGEVETLLATSEVVVLTKDPPDVDYIETSRKLDTLTDVGDQVEDGDKEVEAVVEDNAEIFTEMITEKPEDIVQTCETPESSDNFIHNEVLEETKANTEKYEVDASAETTTTSSSRETDTQQLQKVDSSASHSVRSEVVSQNTAVIPARGDIESKPSFSIFEDTYTKEREQKAEEIEATVVEEQATNLQSTEKALVTNQPQEVTGVALKTKELEEELKLSETPTLDVKDSDSIERMSQRETTTEERIELEHSWTRDEKAAHLEKEEDNDQDVWQDAMENVLTPEENHQEKTEVEFEMSLVCRMEGEETQDLNKTEEKGDTESEGEDFDVALEQLDIPRCHESLI